jgi:hypothetical protein
MTCFSILQQKSGALAPDRGEGDVFSHTWENYFDC